MQELLSWFDVRRVVADKTQLGSQLPKGIEVIRCLPDKLQIGIDRKNPNAKKVAEATLKDWFGERFDGVSLSLAVAEKLPVEFISTEDIPDNVPSRSLWEQCVYAKNDETRDIDPTRPRIVAFHSFRGGVGKTVHLAAHLFALLEQSDKSDNPISILVIDADLCSPRISYWTNPKRTVSLMSFFECYQSTNQENALSYFAQQLRDNKKTMGNNTIYTLPAFSTEQQLLNKDFLPKHLSNDWGYTDSLQALAKALTADYVFMNLESGLSEVSAPILFDNTVHRFLITSSEISSLRGTEMILRYMGRANPRSLGIAPTVILNKMKVELDDQLVEDTKNRFKQAYCDTGLGGLIVETTDHYNLHPSDDNCSPLVVINNWRDAMARLTDTSIKQVAQKWASNV